MMAVVFSINSNDSTLRFTASACIDRSNALRGQNEYGDRVLRQPPSGSIQDSGRFFSYPLLGSCDLGSVDAGIRHHA